MAPFLTTSFPRRRESSATPSWFDKLTMRATERLEALILSLSKDEGRALDFGHRGKYVALWTRPS